MKQSKVAKYTAFQPIQLTDRQWPSKVIEKAPLWCSVDLRDGNQALIEPMGVQRKLRLFEQLVAMGFKEIEVGFPAAAQPEFDFLRKLVDEKLIPDDVRLQVLTQARPEQIKRTFEAVEGVPKSTVHLYNSTSELQRRVVFKADQPRIIEIAVAGAQLIQEEINARPDADIMREYSPESFTGTELEFAVEICHAVLDVWQPTVDSKVILNLPSTVEMATPNIYADQIEWFCRHIKNREAVIVSLHTHNDRGTGVAASELGLLAGADRVEGTLFGNGERTGNADIVNLALNMLTQGVDPGLDVSRIDELVKVVEHCNRLPVPARHPYAGELVYTSFSGSHQDAIKKGVAALRDSDHGRWEVPYLPIDPADVGRTYEAVVRINSQSGKGGVAFVMEHDFGYELPRALQVELRDRVQAVTEEAEGELTSKAVWQIFRDQYLEVTGPLSLTSYEISAASSESERCQAKFVVEFQGESQQLSGSGSGPLDAFVDALRSNLDCELQVVDFHEHALSRGSDAKAVAYLQIQEGEQITHGVGLDTSIVRASLLAVVAAFNRLSGTRRKRPRDVAPAAVASAAG